MNKTNTATLRCNTATECALLNFVREALILGTKHGMLEDSDRSDFVSAIRAADVELCAAYALGIVCEFMVRARPVGSSDAMHRFYLAPYLLLRDLGRQARIIPTS